LRTPSMKIASHTETFTAQSSLTARAVARLPRY